MPFRPPTLVGIHAIRIGGFLFLALLDMRLLPAAFALPARYGDITVGLLAGVPLYILLHIYSLYHIGWVQTNTIERRRSAARTAAQ